MRHRFDVRVGPLGFRVGSAWHAPVAALRLLYDGYPRAPICDFTVTLMPHMRWRRWVRPAITIGGNHRLIDSAPLPLAHGLLAAEMGMNLQLAFGCRSHLLLHAASVERDGRAMIFTGDSGAGKSTLSAMLAARDWRFMGDEFALLRLDDGDLCPFPRPISLKNQAIDCVTPRAASQIGPRLLGTPKGTIAYLRPDAAAIAAMDVPATPALIVFPRHGLPQAVRSVARSEAFVLLTQASTNYTALGET